MPESNHQRMKQLRNDLMATVREVVAEGPPFTGLTETEALRIVISDSKLWAKAGALAQELLDLLPQEGS